MPPSCTFDGFRKNRPMGSLLMRDCGCKINTALCLPHRMLRVIQCRDVGQRLWNYIGPQVCAKMKRILRLLNVSEANMYTFKFIRAGRATALAGATDDVNIMKVRDNGTAIRVSGMSVKPMQMKSARRGGGCQLPLDVSLIQNEKATLGWRRWDER